MRFLFISLLLFSSAFAQFEASSSRFKLKRQVFSSAGSIRQSSRHRMTDYVGVQNFGRMKNANFLLGPGAGVFRQQSEELPDEFDMQRNYPNPFNSKTFIHYSVPRIAHVSISVYSILGQQVRVLVDTSHMPGVFTLHFNGLDEFGRPLPSGLYLIRMSADAFSAIVPVSLVR